MSFGVEYILMEHEHEFLRSARQASEVMKLTVIKADMIWVVKSEISTGMEVL